MSDRAHPVRRDDVPTQAKAGLTPAGDPTRTTSGGGDDRQLSGYGESTDGLVRVWVLVDGSMKDLRIDSSAMNQSADSLSRQVEAALTMAYDDLDRQLGGRNARQDRQLQRIIALLASAHRS